MACSVRSCSYTLVPGNGHSPQQTLPCKLPDARGEPLNRLVGLLEVQYAEAVAVADAVELDEPSPKQVEMVSLCMSQFGSVMSWTLLHINKEM